MAQLQTKLATSKSVNVADDLAFDFFRDDNNRLSFIGRWVWGVPGSDLFVQSLPIIPEMAPGVPDQWVADSDRARALLQDNARTAFDAFKIGRNTVLQLAELERDSRARGFSGEAYADRVAPYGRQITRALVSAASDALAVRQSVDAAFVACCDPGKEPRESAQDQTAWDVAIVTKVPDLSESELAILRRGDLPERLNNARLARALMRAPDCVTNMGAEGVAAIRRGYAAARWPYTFQALSAVAELAEQSRATLASAATYVATFTGTSVDNAFTPFAPKVAKWLKDGDGGSTTAGGAMSYDSQAPIVTATSWKV